MPTVSLSGAADKHLALVTIDEQARPLSIRVLGAYAESLGVRTSLLVAIRKLAAYGHPIAWSGSEVRQIARFLKEQRVTHLGFHLMTASFKPYRLLVQALRQAGFKGVVMAGGVHPTLLPEESLVEGADFAVQGAGERPLEMILRGDAPAGIPGLVWRQAGQVRVNPRSPAQDLDLDALPLPIFRMDRDWALVRGRMRRLDWKTHARHAGWHGRYYDLVTSRGCAYRCAYCCKVYGAPVRRSSVDRVIRELKRVRESEPRVHGVNIQDDSFYAGSDEWVREFCGRMHAEVGLPFIVRMIPRFVKAERIALLKSAGLEYVTMGLEGSTRINRSLFNRKEDQSSFLKAGRAVLDAGLLLSIDYIINNPYETPADLKEVARTLNALPRPHWWVVALSLTAFPGTELYARCVRDGMLDRFATDAYDAMLVPSKPGGYRTPVFWQDLITAVLPHVTPAVGERLIELGPENAAAARAVRSVARKVRMMKAVSSWLRDSTPGLYAGIYRLLRPLSRRPLPSGMKVVE